MCVYVCVCVCMCVMYVCMYVYTYTYAYIHRYINLAPAPSGMGDHTISMIINRIIITIIHYCNNINIISSISNSNSNSIVILV